MISKQEMSRRQILVGKCITVELGPEGSVFPVVVDEIDNEGTLWLIDNDGQEYSIDNLAPVLQVEGCTGEEATQLFLRG
jgi:hypothetical protein